VDAEKGAGAFDVGLRRHFAGRRVDDHDRLAVDEPDDPTCCLGAARAEARCGKRSREREYFKLSKHDVAPLKKMRVCRSGKVSAPTSGATWTSERGCSRQEDFSSAAVTSPWRFGGHAPQLPRRQRAAPSTRCGEIRDAARKKIAACRMRRMPQAVYYGLSARTRTPRLDQRAAALFLAGAAAVFFGA